MPNYRRAFVPGGCWFFTHNLLERRQTLLVDQVDALRSSTVSCAACRIGRIRRFTATCGAGYSRSIGRERLSQQASSANERRAD
jgi:hypothetical protein